MKSICYSPKLFTYVYIPLSWLYYLNLVSCVYYIMKYAVAYRYSTAGLQSSLRQSIVK